MKKDLGIFKISEEAKNLLFLKNTEIKPFLYVNKKLCVGEKNPAYGRQQISWPMRIKAPITKDNFFEEDIQTDVQT